MPSSFLDRSGALSVGSIPEFLSDATAYTKIYLRYHLHRWKSDRVVETEHGFRMSIDTGDFVQRRYLTGERGSERQVTSFLADRMDETDGNFLDIGANVGYYSLLFCQRTSGTAVAFEPLSDNVEKLRENLALNGFDRCEVVPKGLSDERGATEIQYHPANKGGGGEIPTSVRFDRLYQSETAEFERLDDLSQPGDIGLMKIDVEGHELDVLTGARGTVESHQPGLLVETHPKRLRSRGQSVRDVLVAALDCGYEEVRCLPDGDRHRATEVLDRGEEIGRSQALWFDQP